MKQDLDRRIAKVLYDAFRSNRDAMVQGAPEGRATIVDGTFDLVSIGRRVISELELR